MKNDEYMNNSVEPSLFDTENEMTTDEITNKADDTGIDAVAEESSEVTSSPAPFVPDVFDETNAHTEDVYEEDEQTEDEYDASGDDTDGEAYDEEALEEANDQGEQEFSSPIEANQQNKKTAAQNEEKPRRIDSIFDFIELFAFTLAAVFIITSFFFRYSTVKGGSMLNTLENEERLILSSFLYNPKPGDIVVVQDKSTELKDPIVKRVIATAGQTVKFTRYTVYVDGKPLNEDYVYTGDYFDPITGSRKYQYNLEPCDALLDHVIGYQEDVYYEILVPDGEIFVMGDHRNNSKDSRDIGTLHEDAVIGKAVLRFYPFDKFGKID